MSIIYEIAEYEKIVISLTGFTLSAIFIIQGILIYYYKCYNLIAGYNLSSENIKKQYDIEGLSKHIGHGLIVLGVLLFVSTILILTGLITLFTITAFIVLFMVLIIILGSRKFMPYTQNLIKESPSDAKHHFLHWILPEKVFRALEKGSRQWLQQCRHCGYKQDYWEAGNIRYKAIGEPTKLLWCENCKKFRFHKIRKKSVLEAESIDSQNIKINSF